MKPQGLFQRLLDSALRPAASPTDFIILGPHGPGINWLVSQLNSHRDLHLSVVREPDRLLANPSRRSGGGGWGNRVFGQFFSGHPVRRGLISPAYALLPEPDLRALRSHSPQALMVMVVRSPRQNVLHSIHRQATRKRVESLSALDWQKVSDNTSHYGWTHYSKIIPLWDEMFEGRILYLPYDLQFSDPQEFVRRIVERLEPGIVAPPVSGGPQGESGHSNVPLPIVRLVAARTQPDVEFLRSRFPDEFMALCQT